MEEFIKTINHYEYCSFRDRCISQCNISTAAWSYWINGGGVSSKYKTIINGIAVEMFGRTVFEAEGIKA